jgi:hypothetical protein
MGLLDIFNAVQTQLTTVLTGLSLTVPEYRVGADKLHIQDSPPRIVWVPGREGIAGPHAQGGDGVFNPRPLRTRHAQVQVHVWGAHATDAALDLGATEILANHLVAAINDVCHGAWDTHSASWDTGQASTTRKGMVYVLDLELQIPFTRELDVLATVTSMPITPVVLPPA